MSGCTNGSFCRGLCQALTAITCTAPVSLPLQVWVTIAAKLNYDIVSLNVSSSSSDQKKK